jgi:NIPSNAP
MNRRNWFFSLGVSAAGSLAGLSAVTDSQANKRSWVLSLETFRVSHADQMARLQTYLGGTFLPYLAQVHRGPKMFLEAIVAPHTPQALIVTAFPSFDEMIDIRNKVAAHPGIQRARADMESGESQILVTTADSLRFHDGPDRRRGGIFELRSYHALAWRDKPPASANAAFRRAGIHPILTASAAGEHLPRFTYLVPFESLAVRQEVWARLDADSEWSGLEAKVTGASIYKLAPYSPLS